MQLTVHNNIGGVCGVTLGSKQFSFDVKGFEVQLGRCEMLTRISYIIYTDVFKI